MTSEKQRKEESLAGDHEAESLFDSDLKPFIEAVLWKRCSDERSRQKASDIAADVISDCFGASVRPRGDDRLLNLYNGKSSFQAMAGYGGDITTQKLVALRPVAIRAAGGRDRNCQFTN